MKFMDRIIIKIGSRVLTQIDGQLNEDVIANLTHRNLNIRLRRIKLARRAKSYSDSGYK